MDRRLLQTVCVGGLWGLIIGGCTSNQGGASKIASPTQASAELPPGRYCYGVNSETLTGAIRLTVAESQTVIGDSSLTIHHETADYYSFYIQQLEGMLRQGEIAIDILTWVDYDVQQTQETWQITAETLSTEQGTFTAMDCAQARERWLSPDGQVEAADLLEAGEIIHRRRVEFDIGSLSTIVNNAVVAGEQDLYAVYAEGGQVLALTLNTLENNATFNVITPSGLILAQAGVSETLLLPHTGDYTILVGSIQGNAAYQLTLEIR